MGSPDFAVPSLRALAAHHEVVGVYTQPDKPRRRGKDLVPTPVKVAALELGLDVYQPLSLKDAQETSHFASLAPDVVAVAAYGMILPPAILEIPRFGCVNVHASLLPRHRGAAPIHRAILEGDEYAGVSIMLMEEGLDTGPFATTVRMPVGDQDVETLTSKLAELGATALLKTLDEIAEGRVIWTEQDDSAATYAAKITDDDLVLDPGLSLSDALRRVRAASGSARSKFRVAGKTIDVVRASASEHAVAPGRIAREHNALLVGFSDGTMHAEEVRPEGKSVMSGHAFALGARIAEPLPWEHA